MPTVLPFLLLINSLPPSLPLGLSLSFGVLSLNGHLLDTALDVVFSRLVP